MFRKAFFIAVFALAAIGCSKKTGESGLTDIIEAVANEDVGTDVSPGDMNGAPDATTDSEVMDVQPDTGPVALKVKRLDPDRGLASGGQKIQIFGLGFTPKMQVMFGNQPARQAQWIRRDTLEVITPPHPPADVDVVIMRPDGATQTLKSAFTFYNPVAIQSVEPAAIPVDGGVPVVIHGSGFKGLRAVWFGNVRVNLTKEVSDSMVSCVAPPHKAGPVDVKVAAAAGEGLSMKAVTYYERPVISFLDPPAGPVAGGNSVIITGKGLGTATSVVLGREDAKILSKDAGFVTIRAPAGAAGTADVQVLTVHGTAMLASGYIYMDGPGSKPAILNVMPGLGPVEGGNTVMLALNFTPGDPKVKFGTTGTKILDKGQYFVKVTAPPGKGVVDVAINDPEGQALAQGAYTYEKGVRIGRVMPGSGRARGGEDVGIAGSGFDDTCTIMFGDTPAKNVVVQDSSLIKAVTPAHQAGVVNVTIECFGASASLAAGFVFTDAPEVEFLYPNLGSKEGGTLVRVSGTGFFGRPRVSFNGNPASHVEVVSSDLITLRTPMGKEGPADVSFRFDDNSGQVLRGAFVYYDPAAAYGGTWGGQNEGTLNVTAIEGGTGKRVADAYVIIGSDPTTPYQGYTDQDGTIAFAGTDLQPPLTVSISKDCYASESIVVFDSTNVTFIMTNVCQSGSSTPSGSAPGTLSGSVTGLGKYVIPPPGNCYSRGIADDGVNCKPCGLDAECGANNKCVQVGDYGTFCATPCTKPADCPKGWACKQVGAGGELRCILMGGSKLARCGTTVPNIFKWDPTKLVEVKEGGTYTIQSRLGTVSVVCVGGVFDALSNAFTPMVMGVRRSVVVHEGETINDLNIKLDIMLNRRLKIRLDHPPLKPGGPDFIAALIYYDFGAEGVFGSLEQPNNFTDGIIVGHHQPESLTGKLDGVTYTILGGAFSLTPTSTPMSLVHAWGINDIEDDVFYLFDGDKWYADRQGLRKDIYAAFGLGIKQVFVVGEHGAAYLYDGQGFEPQMLPVSTDMFGIWGSGPNDIYAVGDKGAVVHFDGQAWQQVNIPDLKGMRLNVVGGSGPNDVYIGGQYTAEHFDGSKWAQIGSGMDMKAILCTGAGCFAAGTFGGFASLGTNGTYNISTGTSKAIFALIQGPDNCIYLCGEKGYMAKYCNGQVTPINSGTDQTLRTAIKINDAMVFLGDNGTIVRVHNNKVQSLFVNLYKPDIYAAYADPKTGRAAAFGTSHLLLGPMLDPAAAVYPVPNGIMRDLKLDIDFTNEPPAGLEYMTIAIPGLFSDIPVWNLVTAGDVKHVEFPDFESIEGNPGIPKGGTYKATIMRMYAPEVSVDNFDLTDLDPTFLKAWTITTWTFSR